MDRGGTEEGGQRCLISGVEEEEIASLRQSYAVIEVIRLSYLGYRQDSVSVGISVEYRSINTLESPHCLLNS
jgi:hypothetical protein